MSKRVHIICHPQAGGGNGLKVLKQVKEELYSFLIEHLTYLTNYSTHAQVLSEQLIHRGHKEYTDYLIVIGGDGTLHEVIHTLIKHDKDIPVTYIPAGTGNDFHRNWQKNKTIRQIIESMLFSRTPVYIPVFKYIDKIGDRDGIILNNMGFGVDAIANYKTQNFLKKPFFNKSKFRSLGYLAGLLASLPSIPHFSVSGEIDNHPFYVDDVSIAAVLNSPTLGGGINIDQLTQASRPEISLVLYHDIQLSSVFDLLSKVLITKKTYQSDNIMRFTGNRLKLNITEPIQGHVDGEVLSELPVSLEITLTTYPFYLPN